ncbi:MAG: hypothetical protein JW895_10220 [Thermoleophilaceae bacterium]|nr:hypothetical protein [Thermoleophilaceae bacterium]
MPSMPSNQRPPRPPRPSLTVVPPPEPAPRRLGRAWINGREVGRPPAGVAHLGRAYD